MTQVRAETVTAEQAAELTALCSEARNEWRAPADKQWLVKLWCNTRGELMIGEGPTALAAVLAAHERVNAENARLR